MDAYQCFSNPILALDQLPILEVNSALEDRKKGKISILQRQVEHYDVTANNLQ